MNRIIHSLHPMYYPISCIWSDFLTEYLVNIDGGIDQFPQQHGLIALIKFSSTHDARTRPGLEDLGISTDIIFFFSVDIY